MGYFNNQSLRDAETRGKDWRGLASLEQTQARTAAIDADYREPGQPAGGVTLTASVMGCGCAVTDSGDRHEVNCRKVEGRAMNNSELRQLIADYEAVTGKTVTCESQTDLGGCGQRLTSSTMTLGDVRMDASIAIVRMQGVVRRAKAANGDKSGQTVHDNCGQ